MDFALDVDFCIDPEDYTRECGGVIFPNPNAPTGIYMPLAGIEKICSAQLSKCAVVIDEAYIAFGGESAVGLTKKYDNLLIVKTFSKGHALAGMRVGYAVGQPRLIDGLNRIKNSFNSYVLDRLALAAAAAAVKDIEYYSVINKKVIDTRERISAELKKLNFRVLPSTANMLFISHEKMNAAKLYEYLKDNGVLVRYFNLPRIDNFLRVSIGTDEEMDAFINKVKEYQCLIK